MTNEIAIAVIRNPDSTFEKCVDAAGVLAESEATPLDYLVECLKRRGLPAEIAAMKLYQRTKRLKPKSSHEFISNHDDWLNYVRQHTEQK